MINYLPPKEVEYSEQLNRMFPEEAEKRKTYQITFQVTENCCMACTYCYQHNKSENRMTWETAKKIIDKLLRNELEFCKTEDIYAVIFDFIGGEPFMEIDLIEQICTYALREMIKLNHEWLKYVRFSLCSNGLLYDTPKVQAFLKKFGRFVSLAISIDGNKELHDKCRLDTSGAGTYDRAIAAAQDYRNKTGYLPSTKMTLSPDNIKYTFDALLNLIQEGYTSVPFNCVFEKGWTNEHAIILYNELKKIADYLLDNDLYNKINLFMFNEDFFKPMPPEEDQNWCGGVDMKCAAFDYKGDIYPCIRYMASSLNNNQPPLSIGNIDTGVDSNETEIKNHQLLMNITRSSQSTEECFNCPIATGCAWCSGYNYEEFGTPNKRATYICCMHKARALANVYYWNRLYQKLGVDKTFKCYCSKEWALDIISEDEYNYLLDISKGR